MRDGQGRPCRKRPVRSDRVEPFINGGFHRLHDPAHRDEPSGQLGGERHILPGGPELIFAPAGRGFQGVESIRDHVWGPSDRRQQRGTRGGEPAIGETATDRDEGRLHAVPGGNSVLSRTRQGRLPAQPERAFKHHARRASRQATSRRRRPNAAANPDATTLGDSGQHGLKQDEGRVVRNEPTRLIADHDQMIEPRALRLNGLLAVGDLHHRSTPRRRDHLEEPRPVVISARGDHQGGQVFRRSFQERSVDRPRREPDRELPTPQSRTDSFQGDSARLLGTRKSQIEDSKSTRADSGDRGTLTERPGRRQSQDAR